MKSCTFTDKDEDTTRLLTVKLEGRLIKGLLTGVVDVAKASVPVPGVNVPPTKYA